MTPKEKKTLTSLRNDESLVFLEADKGKCMVVMEKEDYIQKMEEKLSDTTTGFSPGFFSNVSVRFWNPDWEFLVRFFTQIGDFSVPFIA